MIHQVNIYGQDKVEVAIERIKAFEKEEGYYLCFSGGKDSCAIKALADMAGVKYDAHYSNTGIDPPELVRFIKKYHTDVIFDNPKDKDGKRITMWNLIPHKLMPPTRLVRYCCKELKEEGGLGRMCMTGVRWAESTNRKKNQGHVTIYHADSELRENANFTQTIKGGVVLTNDNIESRKMIDSCYKQRKTTLNPIIDWTDEEVWEFLREYKVPYCELYDQGFKRLGCIGCPMGGPEKQKKELNLYPKYRDLYIKSFERMVENRKAKGKKCDWETGQDVMTWWLGDRAAEELTQVGLLDEIEELIGEYE